VSVGNGEIVGNVQTWLEVKISTNDCRPDRFQNVTSRFFGCVDAPGARQQVFFDQCEFGFVLHHPKVEAFKIVVRNVFHACLLGDAAKSSQNFLFCCTFGALPCKPPNSIQSVVHFTCHAPIVKNCTGLASAFLELDRRDHGGGLPGSPRSTCCQSIKHFRREQRNPLLRRV
jgi:hypothetical protein